MEFKEQWKDIKGYEDHYQISNLGRVKSKDRIITRTDGVKTFFKSVYKNGTPHYKNKYISVMLKVNQKEKRKFIHRLVAEHFIDNPYNKETVNHINGDKNDNTVFNLEWSTQKENNQHAIDNWLTPNGKEVVAVKDCVIIEARNIVEIANKIESKAANIYNAMSRKKPHKGYLFYNN